MERKGIEFKQDVLKQVLTGAMDKKKARTLLTCCPRTLQNYLAEALKHGVSGIKDKRHGNNYKLSPKELISILETKKKGPWRSARKVLEITGITHIGERRVQKIWVQHGLNLVNVERIKPITRFVARSPNDLWQADIMGKIYFPYLINEKGESGCCAYLIANLDDCSRFLLGGKWFSRQSQMNVFRVWYFCLLRWGLPKGMLADRGSQYKSTNSKGDSTYQHYAKALDIELVWAYRARTKGKIERFWRFVQRDFVRENFSVKTFDELNRLFFKWQIKYNEEFKSSGLGMLKRTPAEVYLPSEIQKPKQELVELLTVTLRRLVYMDSTISLFGKRYKIPSGYIKCRIWLHIRGETVSMESMGNIVYKFRLRV